MPASGRRFVGRLPSSDAAMASASGLTSRTELSAGPARSIGLDPVEIGAGQLARAEFSRGERGLKLGERGIGDIHNRPLSLAVHVFTTRNANPRRCVCLTIRKF